MRHFEVWLEGFMEAPGPGGFAHKIGETDAETFDEACQIAAKEYN